MTLRTKHLKSLATFKRKILHGFHHLVQRSPIPFTFHRSCKAPQRSQTSLFHIIWSNLHSKIFQILKHLFSFDSSNSHTWSRHVWNLSLLYDIEEILLSIEKQPPTSCCIVQLGPSFKSQVQGLDQSGTLKYLLTTTHPPPHQTFERVLGLVGG